MRKIADLTESNILNLQPIIYEHSDPNISNRPHHGVEGAADLLELIPQLILEIKRLSAEIEQIKNCQHKCYWETQPEGRRTIIYGIKERLTKITPIIINGQPTFLADQIQQHFPECYENGRINYKSMTVFLVAIMKDLIC